MSIRFVSPGQHPIDKEIMSWLDTHYIRGNHIRGYEVRRGMDGLTELTIIVGQELVPPIGVPDMNPPMADSYIDPDSTAIIERIQ